MASTALELPRAVPCRTRRPRARLCVACGSTEDLQHHHLVARAKGGSDDDSNLITLCRGCAAKKAQGVKLGGLNAGVLKARDEAKARAEALRPILAELASLSARAIAAELNARKVPTPSGGSWHAGSVIRVQRRLQD